MVDPDAGVVVCDTPRFSDTGQRVLGVRVREPDVGEHGVDLGIL